MKKSKLILIILGLLFSINISSQNNLKVGVIAGVNYPKNRGHKYTKYHNFKVGYLFGVSFDYFLKEKLSLKANINYERKIKKRQLTYYSYEAEEIGKEDFEEIYEYINIPLLIKYEFGKSNFFVNGGPFLNYLLNNQIKPDFPNEIDNTKLKKVDFGMSLGIGTNISLNNKNDFTIEIRDDFGIIDTGGVPNNTTGATKTNAIKLIVGWNLGI